MEVNSEYARRLTHIISFNSDHSPVRQDLSSLVLEVEVQAQINGNLPKATQNLPKVTAGVC